MNLITLKHGSSELILHGSGISAPFQGASMAGKALTLSLAGTQTEIETGLRNLCRFLEAARRACDLPGAERVYLQARIGAIGTIWRSPICGGRLELLGAGPDGRAGGSQGARVTLERADWWEDSAETPLALTSLASPRTTGAVIVHNHWDTNDGNWVQLDPADAGGDLEAPLRLEYTSTLADQGRLLVGQNIHSSPTSVDLTLEGESAAQGPNATRTVLNDSGASGGSYGQFAWSGTGEEKIVTWTLSAALLNELGGRPFLPVVRLLSPVAQSGWWARWKLGFTHPNGENVLWEGRGQPLEQGRSVQTGEALRLPSWAGGGAAQPLELSWLVKATTAGSHALPVDYLLLLPLERWRVYRPSMCWLNGFEVKDDASLGTLLGPGGFRAHTAEGPGLCVLPGKAQRFYFLAETEAGSSSISAAASVRMWYRARKREL